jgi:tetratricopeptide (TPR) repeat protein
MAASASISTTCAYARPDLPRLRRTDRSAPATLDTLGFAYRGLGDHARALGCYRRSVERFRDAASRYHEAKGLIRLGDEYLATADLPAAATAWQEAARIFEELDDPAADGARERLSRLTETG